MTAYFRAAYLRSARTMTSVTVIGPYYSDDRATLYGGDALAVLAALPSGSVDAWREVRL